MGAKHFSRERKGKGVTGGRGGGGDTHDINVHHLVPQSCAVDLVSPKTIGTPPQNIAWLAFDLGLGDGGGADGGQGVTESITSAGALGDMAWPLP